MARLFHAQPLQEGADPLLGEDAHQVVFEREIKRDSPGSPWRPARPRNWL